MHTHNHNAYRDTQRTSRPLNPLPQCGTRGALGDLRLRTVDAWANLAETTPFEVALNGCALPAETEGAAAAKVAAAGSNRAKVKNGVAVFKGVKLSAEGPGAYVLRAASATRKVAVSDAVVTVQVGGPAAGWLALCGDSVLLLFGSVSSCIRCCNKRLI
jgi:hypothetical protein